MSTRLIMFFISILCLFFIVSLSRSIYALWQKGDLVTQRESLRDERLDENSKLKEQLAQVQSQEFIERQAREKLNLSREGEVVVVLPKAEAVSNEASEQKSLPNWQQWLNLFL